MKIFWWIKALGIVLVSTLIIVISGYSLATFAHIYQQKQNSRATIYYQQTQEVPLPSVITPTLTEATPPKNTDFTKFQLSIPVLTYHHISPVQPEIINNAIEIGLRVGPETFENQMKALKEKGYTTLTIDQYEEIVRGDKPIIPKSVLITLDDGFLDNYENAFPILKKYSLVGNFAIVTGALSKPGYMFMEQVKEMHQAGMGIMSHTNFHCQLAIKEVKNNKVAYLDNAIEPIEKPCPSFTALTALTTGQVLDELKTSKIILEKALGIKINSIVYPYGNYNRFTTEAALQAGYTLGFSTKGSVVPFSPETTLFEIPRRSVQGQQSPELKGFFAGLN
jgi:peptidoglycan/xylan/chitin deacetylase (PgdA/CDA1 family)